MDSGERAPTADENECIRRFCLDVSECKEHVEEARSHKRQLMQRRKDLAGLLQGFMEQHEATCIPLRVDRSQPLYLRLRPSSGHRQVGKATIPQGLSRLNKDSISVVAASLREGPPRLAEVLCGAVVDAIRDACRYDKRVVAISPSKERGKRKRGSEEGRPAPTTTLPPELQDAATSLHEVECDLKEARASSKRHNARMRDLTISLSTAGEGVEETNRHRLECIAGFLRGREKRSVKVRVPVGEETRPYFLRLKESRRMPQLRAAELPVVVRDAVEEVFEKAGVDPNTTYQESHIPDLLDADMLDTLNGLLVQRVHEFRSRKSKPIVTITLDRAPHRKAKQQSEQVAKEDLPCGEEKDERAEEESA